MEQLLGRQISWSHAARARRRIVIPIGLILLSAVVGACATSESPDSNEVNLMESPTESSFAGPPGASPGMAVTPSGAPETENPYIGNDPAFDLLVEIRDESGAALGIDLTSLPTKQEITTRVRSEMVNPERCLDLASLLESGYLASEGPLQYIFDGNTDDERDNFVVLGRAPEGALLAVTGTASECKTFSVSRQSPSVIDNSPTQDAMTYIVEVRSLESEDVFLDFSSKGVVQKVDPDYRCLSQGTKDCMFERSTRGFRLLRQIGENLIVVGATSVEDYGSTASKPMKAGTFVELGNSILNSMVER